MVRWIQSAGRRVGWSSGKDGGLVSHPKHRQSFKFKEYFPTASLCKESTATAYLTIPDSQPLILIAEGSDRGLFYRPAGVYPSIPGAGWHTYIPNAIPIPLPGASFPSRGGDSSIGGLGSIWGIILSFPIGDWHTIPTNATGARNDRTIPKKPGMILWESQEPPMPGLFVRSQECSAYSREARDIPQKPGLLLTSQRSHGSQVHPSHASDDSQEPGKPGKPGLFPQC